MGHKRERSIRSRQLRRNDRDILIAVTKERAWRKLKDGKSKSLAFKIKGEPWFQRQFKPFSAKLIVVPR